MTASQNILSWVTESRLPGRARLEEYVSHDNEATLRVILSIDQRAQVEVNDRIVAETTGFENATALAELYTRSREILLVDESHKADVKPGSRRYYHIRVADGAFEACSDTDPLTLVHEAEQLRVLGRANRLATVLDIVRAEAGMPLVPAFLDQQETYDGLGQHGSNSLCVAIWTARRRTPFVRILEEEEFTPLFLTVSKASDGACYTIYRLANGRYLAEVRSHHEAGKVGHFDALKAAVAHCDLFNAARHSSNWITLSKTGRAESAGKDRGYILFEETAGYQLRTVENDAVLLGRFPSVRIAEAYATVHGDAVAHFQL